MIDKDNFHSHSHLDLFTFERGRQTVWLLRVTDPNGQMTEIDLDHVDVLSLVKR